MRPTGTFFIIINPTDIISVTVTIIFIWVFRVIPRPFTKLSRLSLYSFVPLNQQSSFSELLAKQTAAAIRNGTVGRIGSTAPTAPRAVHMQPMIISIVF